MSDFAILVDGKLDILETNYALTLIKRGPGDVVVQLTIHDKVYGFLPLDNIIKAAVRIDPEHASGPERQIQNLRLEVAAAKAAMYDWQAAAMKAEKKLHELEVLMASPVSR